jgi:hypothetical protein
VRSVDPRDAMHIWEQSASQEASYVEKALGLVLLAVAHTLFQDWGRASETAPGPA